jgi:hypothetical protein
MVVTPMARPIPENEITDLDSAVDEAVGLATEGQLAAGYTRLLNGLHRARELRQIGAPWAKALIRRYREAISVNIEVFGGPLGEPE